ncbi:MAG: hypothetical protein JWL89_94 [Candidatus Saccharibacteria bacterium]|jgi:uncharacterized membrane protein YbhN (UPF0104 family)|nr:hypothetical protein [Candidatus Saccharibacteria bacterium]
MLRKYLRPIAAVAILIITVAGFIYYFATHQNVRTQLANTPLSTLIIIFVLYLGTMIALALILMATLRLCKLRIKPAESTLVTAYSAVINFFGPLQSGPAFRAVYLKKKYDLNLKKYAAATLVYYFFFGAFSVLFLLSGVLKWWLLPLGALAIAFTLGLRQVDQVKNRLAGLDLRGWYLLALATFLQVSLVAAIYYTELHSVMPHVSFSQALIYTGAANLAMFVSITPGAIGFRESFLVFSRDLHHISNNVIVTVNILDRAMYIVLLAVLGLFIFATHARNQLK